MIKEKQLKTEKHQFNIIGFDFLSHVIYCAFLSLKVKKVCMCMYIVCVWE